MSLAPGEQETLTEIERQLARSDPGLAAMFTRFAEGRRGRLGRGHMREWWLERGPRTRMIVLAAASVTLIAAVVVLAVAAVSHAAPARHSHDPAASPAVIHRWDRLCISEMPCDKLFGASARLYGTARWAKVKLPVGVTSAGSAPSR